MSKLRQQMKSNAAVTIVMRMWIVTLALLAVPALGALIVGLNQCKDPACVGRASQTAQYVGR